MITKRDAKIFIFSILISTLSLLLFKQPIKNAEAQSGGVCLAHAEAAREKHDNIYSLALAHAEAARDKHTEIIAKLDTLLAR